MREDFKVVFDSLVFKCDDVSLKLINTVFRPFFLGRMQNSFIYTPPVIHSPPERGKIEQLSILLFLM